jgi:hypothetical protein
MADAAATSSAPCVRVLDYRGLTHLSPEQQHQLDAYRAAAAAAAATAHSSALAPTARLSSGFTMPLVGLGTWCVCAPPDSRPPHAVLGNITLTPLPHSSPTPACHTGRRAPGRCAPRCWPLCAVATGTLTALPSMATSTRCVLMESGCSPRPAVDPLTCAPCAGWRRPDAADC